MKLLDDRDERFRNLFGKAALFVLLAALGMGVAFVWTGVKKGAFTATSRIYSVADSGQDLSEGMPVKFSGFKIGKLDKLELDEQGRVQMEVDIETRYLALIHQDAVMTLKKEGVIGDGVLDISRGGEEKPVLAANGKVRFERASGLEQAVIDVKNRIMPILDDLHQTLVDPHGDVRETLSNLHEFSAELRRTNEHLDRLLTHADASLDREVVPMLRSLKASAANAESLTMKLDRDIPELLNKADATVDSLRTTSDTLKDAVQRAAPQIPGVVGDVHETVGKTQKLIGDAQQAVDNLSTHWPLKSDVPPESGAVRMDSHD